MDRLRVGLIGCGLIATQAHIPALARLTSLARLVAVCDLQGPVAEQTARSVGADYWTTSYERLLNDPAIDAVVVATPEFLHAEQTIAAAHAGKHVLCEKPIANTLEEADAMIAAADTAGARLIVAHSRRFTARYLKIRELLDAGAIGEPVLIRENERRTRAWHASYGLNATHWRPDPNSNRTWRHMAHYTSGVATLNAIHEMDLFRWFAGSEARSIYAESKHTVEGSEVPDAMSIQLTFANGVLAASDLYMQAPPGYPYFHQLEIFGTDGVLRSRDADSISVSRWDASGMHFPTAHESLLHAVDSYVAEHRAFLLSILEDTPVPLDPHDARAALELSLAAKQAAATGQRVDLPFVPPTAGEEPR